LATHVADAEKPPLQDIDIIERKNRLRGDEGAVWTACNEVTDKYARKGGDAVGWTMLIEGRGWFGRVGKEMSFGPTTRTRARASVEAFLKGEPFEKTEDERSWRGDCWGILPIVKLEDGLKRVAAMTNPTIEAIRRELAGWNIQDEATIYAIAMQMRVAPSAVRER
jgi:hypothetical protein